jgi:hypothetical protein
MQASETERSIAENHGVGRKVGPLRVKPRATGNVMRTAIVHYRLVSTALLQYIKLSTPAYKEKYYGNNYDPH